MVSNTEETTLESQTPSESQTDTPTPTEPSSVNVNPPYRQRQREESIKSFNLMKQGKMDGLVIACKQHPTNILLALVKYLSYSRPFVVYSPYKGFSKLQF